MKLPINQKGEIMFKDIQNIQNSIGQKLYEFLDKTWVEISLDVKLGKESVGYTGKYLTPYGDEKNLDLWNKDLNLRDAFISLYQTMTADTDKYKWNRAKVALTDDEKLNIKFEWDQELVDTGKRN